MDYNARTFAKAYLCSFDNAGLISRMVGLYNISEEEASKIIHEEGLQYDYFMHTDVPIANCATYSPIPCYN